jgi:ethanolamine ammonia-lyase small subunit
LTTEADPLPGRGVTLDRMVLQAGVTPARLALGRAGSGMPTRAVLDFAAAHALARDAVHAGLDVAGLGGRLAALGPEVVTVESAAPDRETYLRRPDFGRRLSRNARTVLAARPRRPCDIALVVADGLSARAVDENAVPLVAALLPILRSRGLEVGPLVLAGQARVALGDEVGALLGARLVVVLIGERPGLSAADSLGAYLTFEPRLGRTDAERNCVSNIRAGGLPPPQAALTLAWLIDRALALGSSGVHLKDESTPEPSRLTPGPAAPSGG